MPASIGSNMKWLTLANPITLVPCFILQASC